MKSLLTLFSFLIICQFSFSQNMIPNADWEMGPVDSSDPFTGWNSNGAPDGWVPIATPDRIVYGSPALSRDGDPAYSGEAYCVFYYDEGGKCALNFPLEAGKTYCISAWLDVDDNFDAGPGRISFEFEGDTIKTQYVSNTGDWQFFDTTFVAASNSDSLYLFAEGNNLMKVDFMILDTVGCTSAQPAGIKQQPVAHFYLFPNPSNETINLNVVNVGSSGTLIITDLSGKIVLTQVVLQDQNEVDVSGLPSGLYMVNVNLSDKTYTKKFIKN